MLDRFVSTVNEEVSIVLTVFFSRCGGIRVKPQNHTEIIKPLRAAVSYLMPSTNPNHA